VSDPLRVLHLHSGNIFGGIESILTTLASRRDSRIEHLFALSFRGRLEEELRNIGADVRLTQPARISQPWNVRSARSALRSGIGEAEYDVAICHSAWSRTVFGPVVSKRGQPLVLWQHSAADRQHMLDRIARRIPINMAVCNSRFTETKQAVREPGVPTTIIHPPVPPPNKDDASPTHRAEIRAELGLSDETVAILQVGRLERGKGHFEHLQAAARLADIPNWAILFVGGSLGSREEEYETELKRLLGDLGLANRVRFLGETSDTSRFYSASDIYCQPSVHPESFGITYVEAMYAGLPVVATDIGAVPEVVSDQCGRLVRIRDVAGLSEALRGLISNEGERRRLGQRGPERAASLCDPDECVNRLYETLLEQTRCRRNSRPGG